MVSVYLYQLNSSNNATLVFEFRYIDSVRPSYRKELDEISIPGFLLQFQKWDSKTQTRQINFKGTLIGDGVSSTGSGYGYLNEQVAQLVGSLYTIAGSNISLKASTDANFTAGINKATKFAVKIPYPDQSGYYYAAGTISDFSFDLTGGVTGSIEVSFTFDEAEDVLALGGE